MLIRTAKVAALAVLFFFVTSNLFEVQSMSSVEPFARLSAAAAPVSSGFGLAWAVMALMVLALLYAVFAAVAASLGRSFPMFGARAGVLIPVFSVIGLGVAIYLTFIETTNTAPVCGPVGDCGAVQASPYAKLFGVLPVGLLGALGYIGILAAWFAGRFGSQSVARLASAAIFGMALFGVVFSIYLTYLELYVIKAVCMWCLSSAVLISLILALSVGPAVSSLGDADEEYVAA
jgi:uncharacterized membrane protein